MLPVALLEVTLSTHAANWRLIVNKNPHRHDCFDSQYISPVGESYKDSCELSIYRGRTSHITNVMHWNKVMSIST